MIAEKKSRKSPKTAVISRPTRDSGGARQAVAVAPAGTELGFTHFGAEDVDAVARSSVVLAAAAEAFGRALIEMQLLSVSAGLSAASALVDARHLQDVIEIQRRYLNGSVENAVRDAGGLAELASRAVKEAWAPLAPRVGAGRCAAVPEGLRRGRRPCVSRMPARTTLAETFFVCSSAQGSLRWRLRSNIMAVMKPLIFRWIDDVAG